MLTKEECTKALDNITLEVSTMDNEDTRLIESNVDVEINLLDDLIKEHFDNPPLKFEELEDGEWYWCEAYGWCLMNFYEDLHGKIHYKANTVLDNEIDLLVEFEENRFYRKQVE